MSKNIAIDGPAGAGKSTIARMVAKELDMIYVDTGAMYRAIGLYMKEKHVSEKEEREVKKALTEVKIDIEYENGEQQILLNERNVNELIRTPEVSLSASLFAKISCVREKLVELQRELARKRMVVMDGRDIGTHVLPDAFVKIFLTADVKVRAERRYKELLAKGEEVRLSEIEEDIQRRDENDMKREVSPLLQAEDAVLMDTSNMNIEEVVTSITKIVHEKERQLEAVSK